jgi:large subunit ribosomal protein L18
VDAKRRLIARRKRHLRVRRRVQGTTQRPRIAVFRSNRHIYAQVIDDVAGHTLAAASSLEVDVRSSGGSKKDVAKRVGELLGRRARERGVSSAVLDRGGNLYHGRVAALTDGARDAGLKV